MRITEPNVQRESDVRQVGLLDSDYLGGGDLHQLPLRYSALPNSGWIYQ
jgi:hypothetical protein